jgi:RNA polymerase sigma-70 factor (ECF subfamily)
MGDLRYVSIDGRSPLRPSRVITRTVSRLYGFVYVCQVLHGAVTWSVLKRVAVPRVLIGRVEEAVAAELTVVEAVPSVDWTATYAAQRDRLYGLALVILHESSDASDAVQSAFEKALRYRGRLREGVAPDAWLARITCNEAISLARRRRIRRWMVLADYPDVAVEEGNTIDRLMVESALRRLRPKHRAVVGLHYVYGYGVDEIASILGVPRGTVASRLHHAREILRGILDKHRNEQ